MYGLILKRQDCHIFFNCVILKVNKIHHERKGREDEGNG